MGKQKPPKHHHYLPIHYQKGFLNSNGEYFLYDSRFADIKL
jgi:hypothetical protein